MRKSIAGLLFAVMALAAAPSHAITGNYVKDNEHPFVGLIVFYDKDGNFIWRCSGSLLQPADPRQGSNLFLTAGHCADTAGGAVSARVYFQQEAGVHFDPVTQKDPVTGYPDDCAPGTLGVVCATASAGQISNFGFTGLTLPNTHDVGKVILDQPIYLSEYGQLPTAGVLNGLATARGTNDTFFTSSGYGLSLHVQDHSALANVSFRERLMAVSTLVNTTSALTDGYNLQLQGNGDGRGGTCNGDSGGPVFLGKQNSNMIVGVTSFGLNALCRGTDFSFRIDQPEVLKWINTP